MSHESNDLATEVFDELNTIVETAEQYQGHLEDVREMRFALLLISHSWVRIIKSGGSRKRLYYERAIVAVDAENLRVPDIRFLNGKALQGIIERAPWGLEALKDGAKVPLGKQPSNVTMRGLFKGMRKVTRKLTRELAKDGSAAQEYSDAEESDSTMGNQLAEKFLMGTPSTSLVAQQKPSTILEAKASIAVQVHPEKIGEPERKKRKTGASLTLHGPQQPPARPNTDQQEAGSARQQQYNDRTWTDRENLELLRVVRDMPTHDRFRRARELNRRMVPVREEEGVRHGGSRTQGVVARQYTLLRKDGMTITDLEEKLHLGYDVQ